ncbi:hypothetical protein C8Q80DRAFT_1269086 [Daedaleopsis nitida]|nr:hypothetical protein C8Q80DRAFT_1269086 [Daedaleopsis nitida]
MIDLESAPDHHGVALRLHQRYFRDRNSLLDSLAAFEQLAYAKTPELHELHFKLSDHDDVHDSAWWKAQLVQRARNVPKRFHSAVVVGVGRKTAGSGHLWQYLWSVGELPKSDAGTLEANADHVGD